MAITERMKMMNLTANKREILANKFFLTSADIETLCEVKRAKACAIMRNIKAIEKVDESRLPVKHCVPVWAFKSYFMLDGRNRRHKEEEV